MSFGSETTPVTDWCESWVTFESTIVFSVSNNPSPPSFRPILAFLFEFWLRDDAGDRLVEELG